MMQLIDCTWACPYAAVMQSKTPIDNQEDVFMHYVSLNKLFIHNSFVNSEASKDSFII